METTRPLRSSKTPTAGRRLRLPTALALGLLSGPAAAQAVDPAPTAPLTEADVVRLARRFAPAATVAAATERLAEARAGTAGLLANPSLSWARETVDSGPAGGRGAQDLFVATLPLQLARPLTARALVASESAWLRAEASLARADGVLEAVLGAYEVTLAERRVALLAQADADLEEAARVLARREAAGSASGYESTRLVVARELRRSALAEGRGRLAAAKARLAGALGLRAESLRVVDGLEPISAGEADALAAAGGASREAVRRARDSLRLAVEAEARAGRAWLPSLDLDAGLKRAHDAGADSGLGYVLGVSLALPVFDHGQAERRQAEAQRALAEARAAALRREVETEVQTALASFRAAREELARFEAGTSGPIAALLAAARSGYLEGERTIVELLDAQRAQVEVAERRLSLLGTAKRAEARLRAATGDLR